MTCNAVACAKILVLGQTDLLPKNVLWENEVSKKSYGPKAFVTKNIMSENLFDQDNLSVKS